MTLAPLPPAPFFAPFFPWRRHGDDVRLLAFTCGCADDALAAADDGFARPTRTATGSCTDGDAAARVSVPDAFPHNSLTTGAAVGIVSSASFAATSCAAASAPVTCASSSGSSCATSSFPFAAMDALLIDSAGTCVWDLASHASSWASGMSRHMLADGAHVTTLGMCCHSRAAVVPASPARICPHASPTDTRHRAPPPSVIIDSLATLHTRCACATSDSTSSSDCTVALICPVTLLAASSRARIA